MNFNFPTSGVVRPVKEIMIKSERFTSCIQIQKDPIYKIIKKTLEYHIKTEI